MAKDSMKKTGLLLNAFSAGMLPRGSHIVIFSDITADEARALAETAVSAVGHADTAAVFGAVLGAPVPMNRVTAKLPSGSWALLGQYSGPRLAEGAKALPEGAEIRWMLVTVD